MSTSIGNIDIEGQLPLKHKNYDFLTLVLPLDFKIFQTPRVTVIRIGCKTQWAQLGTQGDTDLKQDLRVYISECQHDPLHKPTLQTNELEHSIIWGFIKVRFDL